MKPTAPLRGNFSVLATDPRPWLISFSLDECQLGAIQTQSVTPLEADHLPIKVALQLLRKAFEINHLAVEPVHRQFTAQLLDAFVDGEQPLLLLLLLRRSLQILGYIYGN
jgi:hypothetical protein